MNVKACKNLASAVINEAFEDYQIVSCREEVQAFLFSNYFRLFADLAMQPVADIRRMFMPEKDCKHCVNRYKEHVCVKCYETDPTQTHNYFKKDERKKRKGN